MHRNDGVCALLLRVLAHEAIGVGPRPLAQIGVDGDVAAEQ